MNAIEFKEKLVAMLAEQNAALLPIWVRPPKDGAVEHYSGLGKGVLYALDAQGVIRSACLKRAGAVRGVRLFELRSILDYIASRAAVPGKGRSADEQPTADFPKV